MARDILQGGGKMVLSLQNTLPHSTGKGGGTFRTNPETCKQHLCGFWGYGRIPDVSQTVDNPRSLLPWPLLSTQVPNLSPIHFSFSVSVLRLIPTSFPGPHIRSHCWVCWHTSLNQGSSFSLKSFSSVLKSPSHSPFHLQVPSLLKHIDLHCNF